MCIASRFLKLIAEKIRTLLKPLIRMVLSQVFKHNFIKGLIKYLCKPSSWGNIKLSNLEVFL